MKKYFKSLGIDATFDIEQKFSKDSYIGGRYDVTFWIGQQKYVRIKSQN